MANIGDVVDATNKKDDAPMVSREEYVPEPDLPMLYEPHKCLGLTNTSIPEQFLGESSKLV